MPPMIKIRELDSSSAKSEKDSFSETILAPHFAQNLESFTSLPHSGHMTVDLILAPHFLQNFDFLGFSVPQFGQETVDLVLVLDSMPD